MLLEKALEDPRNQKFVLLSESDIPLYSPLVVYHQLISEPLSRINACNNWSASPSLYLHLLARFNISSECDGEWLLSSACARSALCSW